LGDDALAISTVEFDHAGRHFELAGFEPDRIFQRIQRTSTFYEIDLLRFIERTLRRMGKLGGLAIDVGANLGNHSVFFGAFLADTVISVEPSEVNRVVLERNLETNLHRQCIWPYGLGAADSHAYLGGGERLAQNYGGVQLGEHDQGLGEVEVRRLDDLLAQYRQSTHDERPVSLMKIDVEGMEVDVLRGAVETLDRDRPELFIEAQTLADLRAQHEVLRPLGFRALTRWAATPVYWFTHAPPLGRRLDAAAHFVAAKPVHYFRKWFMSSG
jgi:FkbM family methyltransferase